MSQLRSGWKCDKCGAILVGLDVSSALRGQAWHYTLDEQVCMTTNFSKTYDGDPPANGFPFADEPTPSVESVESMKKLILGPDISLPVGPLTPEQRGNIIAAFKDAHRGVMNLEPIVLDGLIQDVERITSAPREMDFLPYPSRPATDETIDRETGPCGPD